jgi:hypothetical protein
MFITPTRHHTKRSGAITEKHLSVTDNDDEEIKKLKSNIWGTGDELSLSNDLKTFLRQLTFIPSIYEDN